MMLGTINRWLFRPKDLIANAVIYPLATAVMISLQFIFRYLFWTKQLNPLKGQCQMWNHWQPTSTIWQHPTFLLSPRFCGVLVKLNQFKRM